MLDRLIHADWSMHAKKRWVAIAERTERGWRATPPHQIADCAKFIDAHLLARENVLAGFDFPIGLPASFGRQTGFSNFLDALKRFGDGEWCAFFDVAEQPEEISLHRPFYPRAYKGGAKQAHMLRALGVGDMNELRRICERSTPNRRAASPIFWTLGGNQVGKAAIDGWRSVIRPSVERGARLWPFEGTLADLAKSSTCVLCETYPGEAYGHLGVKFLPSQSKRKQEDRKAAGACAIAWADLHGVELENNLREKFCDGFGATESGENPFDACIGVLSMIEVVDGRRAEGQSPDEKTAAWEGWILGQEAAPTEPSNEPTAQKTAHSERTAGT